MNCLTGRMSFSLLGSVRKLAGTYGGEGGGGGGGGKGTIDKDMHNGQRSMSTHFLCGPVID